MTRAIIQAWHKYTPFGGEFYEPILDFQIQTLKKYKDEYDKVYFVDSNWDIHTSRLEGLTAEILKVSPHLRYYDAYKEVLPDIQEDLVLFMDNDMVVHKEEIIDDVFGCLELDDEIAKRTVLGRKVDVISIYDTIGTWKTDKMNGKNKFCPYWFATRKDLLMKYLDVDWSPDMPDFETLGKLTKAMIEDGVNAYEWEEDKTDFPTKDLGYYHIRAGSTPAYLLATKHYGNKEEYWKYLKNQPKKEYLRQCEWYKRMGGDPTEIIEDSKNL